MFSLGSRISALVLLLSLVIVPTVMRSRQHIELRETTRLSIRLNWQSDTPPQRGLPAPTAVAAAVTPAALSQAPSPAPARAAEHDGHAPPPQVPLDNAPDRFRGPPSVLA